MISVHRVSSSKLLIKFGELEQDKIIVLINWIHRIGKEKTQRAVELLKEVNKAATKARSFYEAEKENTSKLNEDLAKERSEDMVICTKVVDSQHFKEKYGKKLIRN